MINIDSLIFLVFLIANLWIGLRSSIGTKTLQEYSLGNRNFSTPTLIATVVATWIGGQSFCTGAWEAYKNGLYSIWVCCAGDLLCLVIMSIVFIPKMREFLGCMSIATAMGRIYGPRVRLITAISGIIGTCALISIQLKVVGMIFQYALGIPSHIGLLSAATVVIIYSSLGGIKSVTHTDVIQFATFVLIIPSIAYLIFSNIGNIDFELLFKTNETFDTTKVFDFTQKKSFYFLSIFISFIIPSFNPAFFQRIAMARNIYQAKKAFAISGVICALMIAIIVFVGTIMLAINPNIESPDLLLEYITQNMAITFGFKGLILIAITSMGMSTVDSYINSTAILVTHDIVQTLNLNIKNQLSTAKIVSFLVGIISLLFSLTDKGMLERELFAYSLYGPIVSIVFLSALLGLRTSETNALFGMLAGIISTILCYVFDVGAVVDITPVAMGINLSALLLSHYFNPPQKNNVTHSGVTKAYVDAHGINGKL